ncbi:MAG: hypothetical protein ABI036_08730 [Fibrobacteria bacterium]
MLAFTAPSFGWQGIKSRPRPVSPSLSDSSARVKPLPVKPERPHAIASKPADTAFSGIPQIIPAGYSGTYLGILEGVRCFNCAPDLVLLNVGDSLSREATILALRTEVWNAMERPVKDRRLFDHEGRCFYFGHADTDSALVGGVWTEIRLQSLPCYPYLHRDLQSRSPSRDLRGNDDVGLRRASGKNPGKSGAEGPAQTARTAGPGEDN